MVESTLETEKVMAPNATAIEGQENPVPFLEQEIECPRCHDALF